MRLREVFRFEIEYRYRRPSTWIYAGLLFMVAIWMFLATADQGPKNYVNEPARVAGSMVIIGMFGMLVSAALFGEAAVRDVSAEMDALLFTSPLRKAEYLVGRFLAALTVNAAVLIAIPLGVMAATLMAFRFEAHGPFRLIAYAQPFFLFSLPNLFVAGAILFTVGMLARSVVPVFLAAIGILIASVASLNYPDLITNSVLAPFADPSGLGALQRQIKYWAPAEANVRLIGFTGSIVWNRVVWLAIASAVLAVLARVYRFRHVSVGGDKRRRKRETLASAVAERGAPIAVPRVTGSFDLRSTAVQTVAIARHSLALFLASRAFRFALLAAFGLTMLWGWNVGDTVFETAAWPVTQLVAGTALTERVTPLLILLTVLYAGELVWQERESRTAEIADATPITDGVALLGRFLALVGVIVAILVVITAAGMMIQALQGYYRFEPGLYLRIVFGIDLANYLLLGALAMTIHVLVNHKYIGHFLVLIVYGSTFALPQLHLVEHHLLLYASNPRWRYSDLAGFGPFATPFIWFKAYWAAWALMLGVIGTLFWIRGRESGLGQRMRVGRARLAGTTARVAAFAALLILTLGGFVFYNTNVLNEYRSTKDSGVPQAMYETRYSRFLDTPQPMISDADLRVEIYPERRAVDMRGAYRLVNRSSSTIDSVHVTQMRSVYTRSITLDRPARQVVNDTETGYRIFALDRPLAPGDSMQLSFDVSYAPRGFPNSDIPFAVLENGSYFDRRWMPMIGYQPALELGDPDLRKQRGLGHRRTPADEAARARRWDLRDADLVHLHAVVGTSGDQTAITPGTLRRRWTEHGRNYFEYETPAPMAFAATIFSARYDVVRDKWPRSSGTDTGDVALAIYHHPEHRFVLDRMMTAMKASLAYFSAEFGAFPGDHLDVVEIPGFHGHFGRAHPNTIAFTEDNLLTRARPGEFDQTFFGTAHEIAHHWWGGQVHGAVNGRGEGMLSETLANYSAMMLTEKTFGPDAARQVYAYQLNRYLQQRANIGHDTPLLDVSDQSYIMYGKGALAMYALRRELGAERVNGALRHFLERYRDAGPPYPTSTELFAELRAVTPDSLRPVLKDWFETITLWSVATKSARSERLPDGSYRVTLEIEAKKTRADSAGHETAVPMNDLVEIGVFARGADGSRGEPLYLQAHRIRSGRQTIVLTVPREPARAGVDPYHWLVDREADDNVVAVTRPGSP